MDLDNREQQESGISLADVFLIIKQSWILITALTLFVGIIATTYAFMFVENEYRSTSEVLVQVPQAGDAEMINLVDTQRLIQSAAEFVVSDNIINKVRTSNLITNPAYVERLNDLTNTEIKKATSVASTTTSFIIRISFRDTEPEFAQEMTQAITTVVIQTDVDLFKDKFVLLSSAGNPEDDSPNKILYAVIGFLLGGVLGVGIAFLKQFFNNSYMTKEQLEMGTGIQVIGVIPEFDIKEKKKR